ncbi:MAG: TonB family protein [Vicinamibacterales bacterium]
MYFDFDDRYQDVEAVGSAISRREGIVLSIVVHVGILLLLIYLPALTWLQFLQPAPPETQVAEARPPDQDRPRFVVIEPLREMPAPPPPKAEMSDLDRAARAPEISERPENPLPFSRGESADRVVAPEEAERRRGPETAPPSPAPPERRADATPPIVESDSRTPLVRETPAEPQRPAGGSLGEALRDLQKYVQREAMNNPTGGVQDFGPEIQFDSKGVEFGPWIRRFIAQVKRNWLIPNAALAMRGHVVIQFNVHRDGAITDLAIVRPSEVDSFNRAAFNALMMSSPTTPLPPEYPDDKAFFTVTFFYNESPSQ